MLEFLTYDLKVAVLIAVFYMFYRLLLARETFHRVNRSVLLLTAVASFVLPLCIITMHKTVVMPMPRIDMEVGPVVATDIQSDTAAPIWLSVLSLLFITGVLATLGHTLWSLFRITSLIKHSEQHPQPDGTTICVTGIASLAPFSWMHYIVMNRSDYEERNAAILAHERGHIRLRHSWDLLLVDTLTALQWFNPAIWMLRSDLRAIHEYEADGAVLSQGINAHQYQYLLITKAANIGGYSLVNGISHSTLKNRISMMHHSPSHRSHLLKLFALLPIVGITLALNAETVRDIVFEEPQKQMVKKGQKAGTIKIGNTEIKVEKAETPEKHAQPVEVTGTTDREKESTDDTRPDSWDIMEEMPHFPGGQKALFEYLAQNVRYPEEAERNNIQGRVIVDFIVVKDGSITNARVIKSIDPMLDEEALRVINSMPDWEPGMQNGKPVNVRYTVPITFRLIDADPKMQVNPLGNADIEIDGKPATYEEIGKIKSKDIATFQVLKKSAEHPNGKIVIATKNSEADVKVKIMIDGKDIDLKQLESTNFNKTGAKVDFDNYSIDY